MEELQQVLRKAGLLSEDNTASTIFSLAVELVRRVAQPKRVEITSTLTPEGVATLTPHIEFGDRPAAEPLVHHDHALRLLNLVLTELDHSVWIALDRLDEAFQGFPHAETPVLRALLRTYLDLAEFKRLRLKLFVRKDLFRRIVHEGFVNLTHVNARKVEIVWDDEDLLDLLCRRFRQNGAFIDALGASSDARANEALFNAVFPRHVNPGSRSPTTWKWMLARIRDGHGIVAPRNLIDLVKSAQEAQQRAEHRVRSSYDAGGNAGVIHSTAIKQGLAALSGERVADTIMAEAGRHAHLVERFRGGRAEHDPASLAELLDVPIESVSVAVRPLVELGFLQAGSTFKVPMLYRAGLKITQGKRFLS